VEYYRRVAGKGWRGGVNRIDKYSIITNGDKLLQYANEERERKSVVLGAKMRPRMSAK